MQEQPKQAKKRGPKVKFEDRQMRNISMPGALFDKAFRVGRGSYSAGLRIMAEAYKEEGNDKPE